ncbi:MAG: GNAT family N-acetyltransferase [Planctomycetales bacterium]|nr:GNAT family N-acetyltransferase [Planctomycetales bacterium]
MLTDVTIYHLEMLALPAQLIAPPRGGLRVEHVPAPPVPYYRFLYESVGRDYDWYRCTRLSDDALAEFIHHPRDEVHVLHVDNEPAGFAELDCRVENEVEMLQFGLLPQFIGQGLGRWFLRQIVELVWARGPQRFWLHTCTLDHPVALGNYEKAGFRLFKTERIKRELPAGVENS